MQTARTSFFFFFLILLLLHKQRNLLFQTNLGLGKVNVIYVVVISVHWFISLVRCGGFFSHEGEAEFGPLSAESRHLGMSFPWVLRLWQTWEQK